MKVSSLTLTILGSLLLVSGVPLPGDDTNASTGTSSQAQKQQSAAASFWRKKIDTVKKPPPGPPVVAQPIVPPSYGGHKDSVGKKLTSGDVKRFRSNSDVKPEGHPAVFVGTDPSSDQHVHVLPMTHDPPQSWEKEHIKDAKATFNVPGVDDRTKIYMKPKKTSPGNLQPWEYDGLTNHQVSSDDMKDIKNAMVCTRANGGSCAYRPGTNKGAATRGGLPVKGGVALPAQKVGGARVATKQGAASKASTKSAAGKSGGSTRTKSLGKNVSGAPSVKGGKSNVKPVSPARGATGKSSTTKPTSRKASTPGRAGVNKSKPKTTSSRNSASVAPKGGKTSNIAKKSTARPVTHGTKSTKAASAKGPSRNGQGSKQAKAGMKSTAKAPVRAAKAPSKQASSKQTTKQGGKAPASNKPSVKAGAKAPVKAQVTRQAGKTPAAAKPIPPKVAAKAPAQAAKTVVKKGGK